MEMKTPLLKISEQFDKDGPKLDELLKDPVVRMLLVGIVVDYLKSKEPQDKEIDLVQPAA
jgi:hypothetical protein